MARPKKYPDELIQRGVRLALEGDRRSPTSRTIWGSIRSAQEACAPGGGDSAACPELLSSQEREEIRRLRREDYELRRATRSSNRRRCFRQGARPGPTEVSAFVDARRERFGSSRSAGPRARRRPPTTSAPTAPAPHERSRTSASWSASASWTRPTTTPTATGVFARLPVCHRPRDRRPRGVCGGQRRSARRTPRHIGCGEPALGVREALNAVCGKCSR
jgi:transposase